MNEAESKRYQMLIYGVDENFKCEDESFDFGCIAAADTTDSWTGDKDPQLKYMIGRFMIEMGATLGDKHYYIGLVIDRKIWQIIFKCNMLCTVEVMAVQTEEKEGEINGQN